MIVLDVEVVRFNSYVMKGVLGDVGVDVIWEKVLFIENKVK